jgi:hypothetical protein
MQTDLADADKALRRTIIPRPNRTSEQQAVGKEGMTRIEGAAASVKIAVVLSDISNVGSAALARSLSLLGFVTGDAPTAPGPVIKLNDAILADFGLAWDQPALPVLRGRRPLASARLLDARVAQRYLPEAIEALRSAYDGHCRIIIEDPRITLVPSLWDAALKALGFSPHRLLIVSNPLVAARMLFRRHQLSRPLALQLWLRYTLAALATEPPWPDRIVDLDSLHREKAGAVLGIAAGLGVSGPTVAAQAAAINALVASALPANLLPSDVVFDAPLIARLVKDCYRLCLDWHAPERQSRVAIAAKLARRFEEFCLIADLLAKPAPAAATATFQPQVPLPATDAGEKRCVIIHYHLFKNAGSSVDKVLKDNFGSAWATQEYAGQPARVMADAVCDFLAGHPEIRVLSSHTLRLPPPDISGVEIFPIIFVRHPIDRIRSAYGFERQWPRDDAGSRVAAELDFAGYIRVWLSTNGRNHRSFQTWRLAMAEPAAPGTELERALCVAERLPFVGCVEAFDASMLVLERLLAPRFPEFRTFAAYENVTRGKESLEERLAAIEGELGDVLYDELVAANADDLVLHRKILARYAEAELPNASRPS